MMPQFGLWLLAGLDEPVAIDGVPQGSRLVFRLDLAVEVFDDLGLAVLDLIEQLLDECLLEGLSAV
jgi:hypothetical protein